MTADLPLPPLAGTPGCRLQLLQRSELPELQALFDANPASFVIVNGQPAAPDTAALEFDEEPPPHLGCSRRWVAGIRDAQGALAGVLVLVADLGVAGGSPPGVWHIALLLVDAAWQGRGLADAVVQAVADGARAAGAQWLRLGVVLGNTRAERFWARMGFVEVRRREHVDTGQRLNTVRVMLRPLAGGTVAAYLQQVPRDAPGSTLP